MALRCWSGPSPGALPEGGAAGDRAGHGLRCRRADQRRRLRAAPRRLTHRDRPAPGLAAAARLLTGRLTAVRAASGLAGVARSATLRGAQRGAGARVGRRTPSADHAGRATGSKAASGAAASSGMALVLGALLDGIPESAAIGISLIGGGGVGVAMVRGRLPVEHPRVDVGDDRAQGVAGARPAGSLGLWALVVAASTSPRCSATTPRRARWRSVVDDVWPLDPDLAAGAILTMLGRHDDAGSSPRRGVRGRARRAVSTVSMTRVAVSRRRLTLGAVPPPCELGSTCRPAAVHAEARAAPDW